MLWFDIIIVSSAAFGIAHPLIHLGTHEQEHHGQGDPPDLPGQLGHGQFFKIVNLSNMASKNSTWLLFNMDNIVNIWLFMKSICCILTPSLDYAAPT